MSDPSSIAPDPSMIGGVKAAPFAFLPTPESLFAKRAARFASLAGGSELGPYLRFLGELAQAQHAIQAKFTASPPLDPVLLERARTFGMPPLDRDALRDDVTTHEILQSLLAEAAAIDMPPPAAAALRRVRDADPVALDQMLRDVLADSIPADALAEHAFLSAALQIQFARLASTLDVTLLTPVHAGTCPACGGAPVVSMVVGWPGAETARYCVCALCATFWHHVRVKCVLCDSTAGIVYREIEGGSGTIKAECCNACHGYVKILYEKDDTSLEAIADDVASLGLDVLLRDTDYRRGGFNPFLLGT